jgi:hypothetical protein
LSSSITRTHTGFWASTPPRTITRSVRRTCHSPGYRRPRGSLLQAVCGTECQQMQWCISCLLHSRLTNTLAARSCP